jgi:CRP/FNR family cyclic AMP-dependent transcriptional regulator
MSSHGTTEQTCVPRPPESQSELEMNLEVLRQVRAFSVVPLETLRLYAYLCRRLCFPEGSFLFHQNDPDSLAYIVTTGHVQLVREYAAEVVVLRVLEPYDFFGGLALLADIRRLFGARAHTRVECLTLDRESFRRLHRQFPEVGIRVLEVMVKRVAQMESRVMEELERLQGKDRNPG